MNTSMRLAILFSVAASVIFAQQPASEYNVTNYPTVNQVRTAFKAKHTDTGNEFDDSIKFWKTVDETTKGNYLEELVQIARDHDGMFVNWPQVEVPGAFSDAAISNLDVRLAAAGVKIAPTWQWHNTVNIAYTLPLCFENYWNFLTEEEKATDPAFVALIHRYHSVAEWPFAAKINHICFTAKRGWSSPTTYRSKDLVNALPRHIKHALREKGESFFTEDGKNPVQDAVNEFIVAMNQPRWGGVKVFVQKWWPNYEWAEVDGWMTQEELDALMEKVYYGDVDFSGVTKNKLMNNLGLEAFNAFVKRYNGQE